LRHGSISRRPMSACARRTLRRRHPAYANPHRMQAALKPTRSWFPPRSQMNQATQSRRPSHVKATASGSTSRLRWHRPLLPCPPEPTSGWTHLGVFSAGSPSAAMHAHAAHAVSDPWYTAGTQIPSSPCSPTASHRAASCCRGRSWLTSSPDHTLSPSPACPQASPLAGRHALPGTAARLAHNGQFTSPPH